jgi:hypothetical protein
MTKYPDLFTALAAPFETGETKSFSKGGRHFSYVTARTVMNRLDEIVGPENWWDDYTFQPSCVVCRLSIRLPDGVIVTKVDAGGAAGLSDEGDDDKSACSDAFKRTAVKFGVGRYLYRDGVATLTTTTNVAGLSEPGATSSASIGRESPSVGRPSPAPRPDELPASVPMVAPVAPISKDRPKTGLKLLQYATNCKVDPNLKSWIRATFRDGYPAAIADWTPAAVERAWPTIRDHLVELRDGSSRNGTNG